MLEKVSKNHYQGKTMEGTKLIVCFICFALLGTSLTVPIPDSWNSEQLQKLEHRIEELTEELKLLEEENLHHKSPRAVVNTVLNENRKLKLNSLLHITK